MTQIVNARFYRLGVNRSWEASWAAPKILYTTYITHDLILFKYIKLFISQYSAPLYFRFPHKDTQEETPEESEEKLKTISKNIGDFDIKDEKAQLEWQKRLKTAYKNTKQSVLQNWLIKRRKYRLLKRLRTPKIKPKKIDYKINKKYRNNLEKTIKIVDISPQPPVETFAANSKKISGNDRIIHNPFVKIGLVFSHLNVLRQKKLILKIFINDYLSHEKISQLSKFYLKRKIKRRLSKMFRRKLSRNLYDVFQQNKRKQIINTALKRNLNQKFAVKTKPNLTKITHDSIGITSLKKYEPNRILIKRKTIRKMIPRAIRLFINNKRKLLSTKHILQQLFQSSATLTKKAKDRSVNKKRLEIFNKFLSRFVVLKHIKQFSIYKPKTRALLNNFVNPLLFLTKKKIRLTGNRTNVFKRFQKLLKTQAYLPKTKKILRRAKHNAKSKIFKSKRSSFIFKPKVNHKNRKTIKNYE